MKSMMNKVMFAFAVVATANVGFAQMMPPTGGMPPPAKMGEMQCARPQMERPAHPKFDEETFKLVTAVREDASEANVAALKVKLAADFDACLAKKQAKLDEMKANREQHIEKMLKCMTAPKPEMKGDCSVCTCGCAKKGMKMGPKMGCRKGPKGPRPEGKGCPMKHGPKGPCPKGAMPEGVPTEGVPVIAE